MDKKSLSKPEKKLVTPKPVEKAVKPAKTPVKPKIEILDKRPIYLCEFCHAMLHVPDECLIEETTEEEDDDGPYKMLVLSFDCPQCNENVVVSEEEIDEKSGNKPVKESRPEGSRSEKSRRS